MSEIYDSGIGVCTMKDQHFLSTLCCFVFYTTQLCVFVYSAWPSQTYIFHSE